VIFLRSAVKSVCESATQPAQAAADGREGAQFDRTEPCIAGHRFEPGPIVDGHYRQPTRAEFEARTRELLAISRRDRGRCSAPPLPPTAGAAGMSPALPPPNPEQ
jgi:hypothetical protein